MSKPFNVLKVIKLEYQNNHCLDLKTFKGKQTKEQKDFKKKYKEYLEIKRTLEGIPFNTGVKTLKDTRKELQTYISKFKTENLGKCNYNLIIAKFGDTTETFRFDNKITLQQKKEKFVAFANLALVTIREKRRILKNNIVEKRVSEVYPSISGSAFSKLHFKAIGNDNIGYVHVEKNDIKRYEKVHVINKIFDAKKPKTNEHHVGIEIEMFTTAPQYLIAEKLVDINKYLHLKTDTSIRPDKGQGHELVICVPESKRIEIVNKVSQVLKELNCKVNSSCGLHVHIDMRNRDKKLAFSNLVTSQNILYMMNPKSRNNGQYCKTTGSKDIDHALQYHERYCGINAQAFKKHQTLEIRIHSGTIDGTKINNWVTILESIVDTKKQYIRSTTDITNFAERFDISPEVVTYIDERIKLFSKPNPENEAA